MRDELKESIVESLELELGKLNKMKEDIENQRKEYQEEGNNKYLQFKNDLFEELGISNHPKRDKLFELAEEFSNGGGMDSVYNYAYDLTDILD